KQFIFQHLTSDYQQQFFFQQQFRQFRFRFIWWRHRTGKKILKYKTLLHHCKRVFKTKQTASVEQHFLNTITYHKMKKIVFIAACIVSSQYLLAQEPADALRYSWYTSNGTARQQAIGGAGGSLGGDISAVFLNPAGLGFYKTGDFVLTPAYNLLNNKGTYFSRTEKDKKNALSFGTSG